MADTDPCDLVNKLNNADIGEYALLQLPADRRFVQLSAVINTPSGKLAETLRLLPPLAVVNCLQGLWDVGFDFFFACFDFWWFFFNLEVFGRP